MIAIQIEPEDPMFISKERSFDNFNFDDSSAENLIEESEDINNISTAQENNEENTQEMYFD